MCEEDHIGKKFVAASSREKPRVVERVGQRGQTGFRDNCRLFPPLAPRTDFVRLASVAASSRFLGSASDPEFGQGHTSPFARDFRPKPKEVIPAFCDTRTAAAEQ